MPSFRSSKEQAAHAVSQRVAFGKSRHHGKEAGNIHSVRTAQAYTQALSGFVQFIQKNRLGDLKTASPVIAQAYLYERQESGLSQKTLDQDRQALQNHFRQTLERLQATVKSHLSTRSYTPAQIQEIVSHQNERNALATLITHAAGLRAHELNTIRPVSERSASTHREWSTNRFAGRDGVKYTVEGKGGLIREVLLPSDLAERLEATRFQGGLVSVVDRGVNYMKKYNLGSGKSWSVSFSRVSASRLGWTNGGHGLRHSYAQERMGELQAAGYKYQEALGITAQELGHFAATTTEVYLR
jgi:integrase